MNERRKGRDTTTAREVPPAIQWHEGMLLAPQHFQALSLRHEALLHYHAASLSPFHWGVRHLEIDPVSLPDGLLRVTELEAVMPDGLVVSRRAGDVPPLAIDLAPRADELRLKPATVHLAVCERGNGLPFAERFAFEDGPPMADENGGDGDVTITIPVLRPRLQLIAGDPPPKYVSFPLLQITCRNEVFSRTRFEPPWLRVAPGSALYALSLSLSARLREKALFLAEQVRSLSTAAREPQIVDTKAMVHALIGELPAFEAVLRTGASHPFALYIAMSSLLGHVAGLTRSLVPPPMEPYDHNDLYATFAQVRDAIAQAIEEKIQESYTPYPFLADSEEFRLPFDADWSSRSLVLGVRAPFGVSELEMAQWVSTSFIGGRSKIVSLRDRRFRGIGRRKVESATDLVPSRGVTLFAIQPNGDIEPGEELVIVNPDAQQRPEEIVLYVRNRA
jgi:type VI secretion system protein ImpJ